MMFMLARIMDWMFSLFVVVVGVVGMSCEVGGKDDETTQRQTAESGRGLAEDCNRLAATVLQDATAAEVTRHITTS